MKLKELKATDFSENKKYNFLFPIGATEQHGPFLPFGTDTYITDYLVNEISKKFPDLIILPTLEYSRSREHRGFYGTLWLTEETLSSVMFDICNSLKEQAGKIFITSFHANEVVIEKFIKENLFPEIEIIHLEMYAPEDDEKIEKILKGPFDDHAGNTEISNMLCIDESLVKIPPTDFPKTQISDPFGTDNLKEKSSTGIADNHPDWKVDKKIGKEILDIYVQRMSENLKKYL